jgi:hypothetical protein
VSKKTGSAIRLTDLHPAGFYTEEIRGGGVRWGFWLVGFDGRDGILAPVDIREFEAFLGDLDLEESPIFRVHYYKDRSPLGFKTPNRGLLSFLLDGFIPIHHLVTKL